MGRLAKCENSMNSGQLFQVIQKAEDIVGFHRVEFPGIGLCYFGRSADGHDPPVLN